MPLVCLSGCFPDAPSGSDHRGPLLCRFLNSSLICGTTTLGKIKKRCGFFFFNFSLQTLVLEMCLCHVELLGLVS